MVRVVQRLGAAVEGRVVERPFRRSQLPDQLGEIVGVFLVTRAATVRGEVKLIPPLQFSLGRQRVLAGRLITDQVTADRHQRLDPLWPQRRDDVG
ncbi:hypothetical protein D3C84_646280 [compost metagenome]